VLWAGPTVGRPEYDDLAGRTSALDLAVAQLDLAGLSATDAALRADLELLRGGAVARVGARPWDAAGRRLVAALQRDARAAADDVAAAATGRIRERTGRAVAAVLGAVVVLALTLAHGLRLSRRFARALEHASVEGAGEPYTTVTRPLGWGEVSAHDVAAPPDRVPPPARAPTPESVPELTAEPTAEPAPTLAASAVPPPPPTLPFGVPVPRRRVQAPAGPSEADGPRHAS
jgi:hypothetical protein